MKAERTRFEEVARATLHVVLIDGDLPQGYRLKEPVAVQVARCGDRWAVLGRNLLDGRGDTEEEAIQSFKRCLVSSLERLTREEKPDDAIGTPFSYAQSTLAYLRSIIIQPETEETVQS